MWAIAITLFLMLAVLLLVPDRLAMPVFMMMTFLVLLPVVAIVAIVHLVRFRMRSVNRKRERMIREGACLSCGYRRDDLAVCPECGARYRYEREE